MAHEFVKLSTVDMVSSVNDDVNILVEQEDSIKRMNIADIPQRPQADWNETNESSPAYILNKPDFSSVGGSNTTITYFVVSGDMYRTGEVFEDGDDAVMDDIVNAFNSGVVRLKFAAFDAVCTLLTYYTVSGSARVYYVDPEGQIRSFTV